jgi:hypothetical protein
MVKNKQQQQQQQQRKKQQNETMGSAISLRMCVSSFPLYFFEHGGYLSILQ